MATLYLIPSALGSDSSLWLPEAERQKILHIQHFIVENEKPARHHLKALGIHTPLRELSFNTLNQHTPPETLSSLLSPLRSGHDMGLLSDAGCPAVADPGAQLVALAHQEQWSVIPLIGPSSILLALMASGANGQHFMFHGYLPVEDKARIEKLKRMEHTSQTEGITHLFIETPYRNQGLLQWLLKALNPQCRLMIACDLTLPTQMIISHPISQWPKILPNIHKRPTIFLINAK